MAKRYTSENQIRVLFKRQHGKCARCPTVLIDVFHIDHITALALGGTDTLDNKQLLCIPCHRLKTSGGKATSLGSDIFEISKTKRLAKGKRDKKHRWPKRSFRLGQKKSNADTGDGAGRGEASDNADSRGDNEPDSPGIGGGGKPGDA